MKDLEDEVRKFYHGTTAKLLEKYTYEIPGKNTYQVDIVRDISNLVNARFAACVFNFSIKSDQNSKGTFTDQEIYENLAILYSSSIINQDVARGFELREAARNSNHKLSKLIRKYADQIKSPSLLAQIKEKLHERALIPSYGITLIQQILRTNTSTKDVVWNHM